MKKSTIPSTVLLTALKRALDEGSIKPKQIESLLGAKATKRTSTVRHVPRNVRVRVAELSEQHGLRPTHRFATYGLTNAYGMTIHDAKTCKVVQNGLSESFKSLRDVEAAAQRLVTSWLMSDPLADKKTG